MARKPSITGLTRARERQYQERVSLLIAASIERLLKPEIAKTMAAMARLVGSKEKQASILSQHEDAVKKILTRAYRTAFEKFGKRIIESGKKSFRPFEHKDLFSGYDKAATAWIGEWTGRKVTEIVGTTRDQAIAIIEQVTGEAVFQGLGQAEAGKVLQDRMKERAGVISQSRARVIARTETHAASQSSGLIAAQESGITLQKEWISSRGERTREAHAEADGQTVGIDEPFIVDGEELMYPGDPDGSAGNVINCRCVIAYVPLDD